MTSINPTVSVITLNINSKRFCLKDKDCQSGSIIEIQLYDIHKKLTWFFQLYWVIIDKIIKCTTQFYMCKSCETILTIKLFHTSISHIFAFFSYLSLSLFFFVRKLKIFSEKISIVQCSIINYSHHDIH